MDKVDSHFTLNACMDGEEDFKASGDLYAGQYEYADPEDKFHYKVHCMDMDTDNNVVHIGAEVLKMSEHHKIAQDPEAHVDMLAKFADPNYEGDRSKLIKYEKFIHEYLMNNEPGYSSHLLRKLETQDVTLEEYEDFLGQNEDELVVSGLRDLPDQIFVKTMVPLLGTCATIEAKDFCTAYLEDDTSTPDCDPTDISFDSACCFLGFFLCVETVILLEGGPVTSVDVNNITEAFMGGNRKLVADRQHLIRDMKEKNIINESQGTLALFRLEMNPSDDMREDQHSIAVKFNHDFDTTCEDFQSVIDHDYFGDSRVMSTLTKGAIKFP